MTSNASPAVNHKIINAEPRAVSIAGRPHVLPPDMRADRDAMLAVYPAITERPALTPDEAEACSNFPRWHHWVIQQVCAKRQVAISDVLSCQRLRRFAEARWEIMWELRSRGESISQIGRWFRLDHTSVMYGIRQHDEAQERGRRRRK